MNTEEFQAAEEIVKKTNALAQKFYRRMLPRNTVPRTMHGPDNAHVELCWEMACEAHNYYYPDEDPAELLDEVNDVLNAQPDHEPCADYWGSRLDDAA
ncbi:MAG: hypothetical protein JWM59_2452 [Verrucomicrobiales bacterium]|nr:hypothetical protein [Verrucomicrobiales bacterium]